MSEAKIKTQEFNSESLVIEKAVPDDSGAIMTLKRAAWLDAYPNKERVITVEDIRKKLSDDMMPAATENWRRGIASEVEGGDRATFVARLDNEVVGFTSPCIESGQRRIGALYVSPDAQGKGVGSKLLGKALEWHGLEQDIFLCVVSYNDGAIRLYERFGFRRTGVETPQQFDERQGIKLLPEIEMIRPADEN